MEKPRDTLLSLGFDYLVEWIEDLLPSWANFNSYFIVEISKNDDGGKVAIVRFYTKEYTYRIVAIDKEPPGSLDGYEGYLGATMLIRKPRAGEDHKRGRDLRDGRYDVSTWRKIKDDIIFNEMVKVVKPTSPMVIED